LRWGDKGKWTERRGGEEKKGKKGDGERDGLGLPPPLAEIPSRADDKEKKRRRGRKKKGMGWTCRRPLTEIPSRADDKDYLQHTVVVFLILYIGAVVSDMTKFRERL